MLSTHEGVKLFWPSHLCSPKTKHGFLIGWYNTTGTVCVASVVPGVEVIKQTIFLIQQGFIYNYCIVERTTGTVERILRIWRAFRIYTHQ
jgi:hypothetical protein